MARSAWLGALVLFLFACSDSPTAPPLEPGPVPFTTVLQTQFTGVATSRQQVIRSSGAWSQVWEEMYPNAANRPPLPAVDFGAEMLLLAAAGEKPHGCHWVEIRSAEGVEGRLQVGVVETGDEVIGCLCHQAVVYPVHVVRLARTSAQVVFDVQREPAICD
ncbi:MAG: hypothetical protein ACRD0X_01745 [Thermoanaerobaculia bacterium]